MAKTRDRLPEAALQAALRRRGWTQADLARELSVPTGTVNNWCVGRRRPNITFALEIQAVLGVPLSTWARQRPTKAAA